MSYKDLKSYNGAKVIYDFSVEFCNLYIDKKSRTHDQMVQAARSGKQNIVEGSAEKTSEKSELLLLGVARASLAELLEDYEDFLRQRKLQQWDKDDPKAKAVRGLVYRSDRSDKTDRSDGSNKSDGSDRTYTTYSSYLSDPEGAANAAICLIHQTAYLLDQQIRAAEKQFVKVGDYSDQLKNRKFIQRTQEQDDADKWLASELEKLKK